MSQCLSYARTVLLTALLSAPILAQAQAQAPNEAQLREMMEQMRNMEKPNAAQMESIVNQAGAMQSCMADIDQAAFETLGRESESLMQEIKGLCAAGKRDEAQNQAMAFATRVAASPELKKMAECSKGMQGLLPSMAGLAQQDPDASAHVCDSQ